MKLDIYTQDKPIRFRNEFIELGKATIEVNEESGEVTLHNKQLNGDKI